MLVVLVVSSTIIRLILSKLGNGGVNDTTSFITLLVSYGGLGGDTKVS